MAFDASMVGLRYANPDKVSAARAQQGDLVPCPTCSSRHTPSEPPPFATTRYHSRCVGRSTPISLQRLIGTQTKMGVLLGLGQPQMMYGHTQ